MIAIIEQSRELSKVEKYLLSASPAMESLKDVPDGTKISVSAYCMFEEVNEDTGEKVEILSIMDDKKHVYACQSATFKKEFRTIFDLMDGDAFTIVKKSGKTKANRDFITCILDTESM